MADYRALIEHGHRSAPSGHSVQSDLPCQGRVWRLRGQDSQELVETVAIGDSGGAAVP